MRIIYLFTMDGAAPGAKLPWSRSTQATNKFVSKNGWDTEGFCYLFQKMIEEKIVEGVLIFVESTQGTGIRQISQGMTAYVVPEVDYVHEFIREGDIIFARGGFKSWFTFLDELSKLRKWILFYRAATNRNPWQFWDIVFNDLISNSIQGSYERLELSFKKPTNPLIFKPLERPMEYDVCIGASHIHDKKAQWKTVNAIAEYKKIFKKELHCILPGADHGRGNTRVMFDKINSEKMDIKLPGMLARRDLVEVYNKSKLYVHMGSAGQNDRGVLEAMSCGCPVIIGHPSCHAPFTFSNGEVSRIADDPADPKRLAYEIHEMLEVVSADQRKKVSEYYESNSGINEIIIPQMKKLFDYLGNTKAPDRSAVCKEFIK